MGRGRGRVYLVLDELERADLPEDGLEDLVEDRPPRAVRVVVLELWEAVDEGRGEGEGENEGEGCRHCWEGPSRFIFHKTNAKLSVFSTMVFYDPQIAIAGNK